MKKLCLNYFGRKKKILCLIFSKIIEIFVRKAWKECVGISYKIMIWIYSFRILLLSFFLKIILCNYSFIIFFNEISLFLYFLSFITSFLSCVRYFPNRKKKSYYYFLINFHENIKISLTFFEIIFTHINYPYDIPLVK